MTKKEKEFCVNFSCTGNIEEAEKASGLLGRGRALLCREDIAAELKKLCEIKTESLECAAKAGLLRLATGSRADAVRLVCSDDPGSEPIEELDLFDIAEIKRKDNLIEIKFCDRYRSLERLIELGSGRSGAESFYDALVNSSAQTAGEDDDG